VPTRNRNPETRTGRQARLGEADDDDRDRMHQVIARAGLEHGEQVGGQPVAQGVCAERAQGDGENAESAPSATEDHAAQLAGP
jgi:hypothetical protein